MKSSGSSYNFVASYGRDQDLSRRARHDYVESHTLPSRDIPHFLESILRRMLSSVRGHSQVIGSACQVQPAEVSQLYRAFVSEMVALMDGSELCREVNIVGDGVWGVFNTPYTVDVDDVFSTAAMVGSIVKFLNHQLREHNFEPIAVGIGLSYGRALVIKAGYSGSGISDVVYMGDVVNQAAKLSSFGCQVYGDRQMMVSPDIYVNFE